ncbi:uncharacterized protein LOC119563283 [Drosophila subpulchrella]|uniref:uncharacterized protein LOC119563283 n=1 Tax=Drosophila subpulchrella TaxID=1486046 RepID=UPI0018A190EE|nr:uncharacterized protein LOC119563283 [Drosophila subpulchrella]XP_037732537.1 uncharacterized protein LOC119563283 [Drosophila subpulchrella]
MNFSWLTIFILALFAMTVSAKNCPAPFEKHGNKCTIKRPIHGECPHGSQYSANINLCVYKN